MTDDKLAAALVGKFAVKLQNGDDVYKIVREIENRSKRNPTLSCNLIKKGVILPLLDTLRKGDLSRLELKQRCLGTFVNLTSKQPEGKHACLEAGVLDYVLDELHNFEGNDAVCKKWLLGTITNLLTIKEAKTNFIADNGVLVLVNVLKSETETLPVRGLASMALGNIIKDSNEYANVAFKESVCDVALELLQQDQTDCQNSAAFILDIIIWKVPKAAKYYISSGAVSIFARSLRYEELPVKSALHLVSCLVKLLSSENYIVHELRKMKLLDTLKKLSEEDPEILRIMDPSHNLQLLIGALKFSSNGIIRNVTELDQYSQSQYSESVVERRSTDTTESVDKLKKLSETLSTPEELEVLIKSIYESCKDDELISEDMIDKGALAQLLKLINSHNRNVRKFAAATLAVLTNGFQKGWDCFHDNGGPTLLLQTIPNEDDNVVRRLLVNALSNSLAYGMIIEQFVAENGLPLYIGIIQKDTDSIARSWAAIGIGNVANYSSKYCEELVMAGACELSIELITHQHPRCKSAAVRTLGVLLTKCPNMGVQKTTDTSDGLKILVATILADRVAVETKLAASWCLGEIAEVDPSALSAANENLGELREALLVLKESPYNRNDRKFLHQKLDRLIKETSTNDNHNN